MNRPFFLLFILVASIAGAAQNPPDSNTIRLSWNFENGSLGEWKTDNEGRILLTHAPGAGGLWYHFRVDGVLHKNLTFVFEDARKDFFGGRNLPAISYDGTHWHFIKKRFIQPHPETAGHVRFLFSHTFAKDRAWIAYSPPFTPTRLAEYVEGIRGHPHVNARVICETPLRKRPLTLLQITNPDVPLNEKKTILILCREDAYETAGSWVGCGMVNYLLSKDPSAEAVKRRAVFLIVPLFDCDGAALGRAVHPFLEQGPGVYWTETWPETTYSFYEQRQLKSFLQQWKNGGGDVYLTLRLHSDCWNSDLFRREHCAEENYAAQDSLFLTLLGKTYLPWYRNVDRVSPDSRFSKFVYDLFPNALTASSLSEYVYSFPAPLPEGMYKSVDDLMTEGELLARAVGESLGVPSSDPPPLLQAAEFYEITSVSTRPFHARCLYRDGLNRPPEYVRVMVNEKSYPLEKAPGAGNDFKNGVLYTGFLSINDPAPQHYFVASNGATTIRIPREGARSGPFIVPEVE